MRSPLFIIAMSFIIPGLAVAKDPAQNVRAKSHPNIAAAQRLSASAFEKLEAAQRDNEFDLAGHAQKAKSALELANNEMKAAADAANQQK